MCVNMDTFRANHHSYSYYPILRKDAIKSLVVGIGYQGSRVAGVPHNFDARPFGENILSIVGTHDLHSKSGWLSSIECRSRRTILIAIPRAMVAPVATKIASYRSRYLAFIANSGIKKEKRKREREKEKERGRIRVETITRSNFVRPSASAHRKIVLQRGSFVTTENNEANEFDRVTAARD